MYRFNMVAENGLKEVLFRKLLSAMPLSSFDDDKREENH